MSTRGRFLVFEGIDGAGKSTQIAALSEWLQAQGVATVTTREPGGTPVGEAIRTLVLTHDMHAETELMLICAARREHLLTVIDPALAAGRWVVCDRFADASFAYQVGGRGVDRERFRQLDEWTRSGRQPDLVFLFDLPVAAAAKRRANRDLSDGPSACDRFERESEAFFAAVRAAYLARAAQDPERYCVLDAQLPPERLTEIVLVTVAQRWFAPKTRQSPSQGVAHDG